MKILFVYEHLFPPFDEGIKIFAERILKNLTADHDVRVVTNRQSLPDFLNNFALIPRLIALRLHHRPDRFIYIPYSSLTFATFVRIIVLRIFFGQKLVVVGTQKKVLSPWQEYVVAKARIRNVFALSASMVLSLRALHVDARQLNVGIDHDRYLPTTDKMALRRKHGIPLKARTLLHVGHIRESRNIAWLLELKARMPDLCIILVGSTSTERDAALYRQLVAVGVIVFNEYLADIHEIYQLADVYCFPVIEDDAAMETPLSVLEAMATNLPVVTTQFGRIPEQFREDADFRYVEDVNDIVKALECGFPADCKNRNKTLPYSWRSVADTLISDS